MPRVLQSLLVLAALGPAAFSQAASGQSEFSQPASSQPKPGQPGLSQPVQGQAGKPASGSLQNQLQIQRLPISAPAPISPAAASALRDMAQRAGVVFAGRVLAVNRQDDAGFVDIRFAVDEAIKGCTVNKPYVLREWAGLWEASAARYIVGERLLLFLTPRSASGLSAPVDGIAGVLPLHATVAEPLADAHGVAPAEDGSDVFTTNVPLQVGAPVPQAAAHLAFRESLSTEALGSLAVDLRWLQTTLERTTVSATPTRYRSTTIQTHPRQIAREPDLAPESTAISAPAPLAPAPAWPGPVAPLPTSLQPGGPAPAEPALATLLPVLRAPGPGSR